MNKTISTTLAVLVIGAIGTGAAFGYEALAPTAPEPQLITDIAALEPSTPESIGMPEVDIAEPVAPAPERISAPSAEEEPAAREDEETVSEAPAAEQKRDEEAEEIVAPVAASKPEPAQPSRPAPSKPTTPVKPAPAPVKPSPAPAPAPAPSKPATPAPAPSAPAPAPAAPAPAPSAPAAPAPAPSPSAPAAPKQDFKVVGDPRIGGKVKPGSPIFAFAPETITPANGTVSWQWFRNGTAIAGATSHKYTITTSDIGSTLTARLTIKLSGYNTYTDTTPATVKVPETEQTQIHKIINEQRAAAGLRSVTRHSTLDALAQQWACHMAQNGYGHSTNAWRNANLPAGWRMNGENIAAGYTTVQEVTTGWINSPDHRANILRSNFTHVGVGYCYNVNDPYKHYWVQLFAQY